MQARAGLGRQGQGAHLEAGQDCVATVEKEGLLQQAQVHTCHHQLVPYIKTFNMIMIVFTIKILVLTLSIAIITVTVLVISFTLCSSCARCVAQELSRHYERLSRLHQEQTNMPKHFHSTLMLPTG